MNIEQRTVRRKWGITLFPILVITVSMFGLIYGSVPITLVDIWNVLTGSGESIHETIILQLRLPRVLIGLLVEIGRAHV